MEHGGDADAGTKMPWIGRDGQHRLGGGAEEQIIDHGLVLPGDVGNPGRQREHDVEVADRQQIGLARGEPVPGRGALALTWANSRQPDFAAYGFMDYLLVLLWIRG
jgi:hypothetical protein